MDWKSLIKSLKINNLCFHEQKISIYIYIQQVHLYEVAQNLDLLWVFHDFTRDYRYKNNGTSSGSSY